MKVKVMLEDGREVEIELTNKQRFQIGDEFPLPSYEFPFYGIDESGRVYEDCRSMDSYLGSFAIGNYFTTEEKAEDTVRALKLIEAIKRDRYRLQGEWKPSDKSKWNYEIRFDSQIDQVLPWASQHIVSPNPFGTYQSEEFVRLIIEKYEDDLRWFFGKLVEGIYD